MLSVARRCESANVRLTRCRQLPAQRPRPHVRVTSGLGVGRHIMSNGFPFLAGHSLPLLLRAYGARPADS